MRGRAVAGFHRDAAEACFSGREVEAQIRRRLAALRAQCDGEPELARFLGVSFAPLLEMLDGIVFILNGRVVAGTLDEVVRSDLLSQLYETAVHVHVTSDGHRFVVGA